MFSRYYYELKLRWNMNRVECTCLKWKLNETFFVVVVLFHCLLVRYYGSYDDINDVVVVVVQSVRQKKCFHSKFMHPPNLSCSLSLIVAQKTEKYGAPSFFFSRWYWPTSERSMSFVCSRLYRRVAWLGRYPNIDCGRSCFHESKWKFNE